ncbi:MerR family transcriptional regulator [Streptomyces sp. t39]|uniref:MerR family transcriptional regulator n=1 Tax=Streptomyces sp. t39 TaxID=1828156 RepID=UPI0011CD7142|nr:MerR family transcriptional regulator [Streptomyces sp. t39]TXS52710.1 MerR family transcriptional regulator [Streptomyces sp. t39]
MRIGEIAALVGVSTRAVRHYHHLGLLPEPVRLANGYRDYTTRDAVLLARIRRLTELGVGLDEVRDVLAEDAGRDLAEVLEELDADLGRQEARIRTRRERLADLLERARAGRLPAEGPVSPWVADLFAAMAETSAALPGPEPAMAAVDREMLALLDTVVPEEEREAIMSTVTHLARMPGGMERAYELYRRMDELAGTPADDPRVEELARVLSDSLPDELAVRIGEPDAAEEARLDGFLSDLSPAQSAVVRRALHLLRERAR